MKHFLQRKQAGDTIVEVLIAIAIVSLVLVGAFLITNSSTTTVQDNQEHTQAQQQLQAQVEDLRAYLTQYSSTNLPPPLATTNCMTSSGTPADSTTSSSCNVVSIGGTTGKPTFTYNSGTYTFSVRWTTIKNGNGFEQFVYRVYPGT